MKSIGSNHGYMENQRLLELLLKKKYHTLTIPEQEELSNLEQRYDEASVMALDDFLKTPLVFTPKIQEYKTDEAVNRLREKLRGDRAMPAKKKYRRLILIAAACLVVAVSSVGVYLQRPQPVDTRDNVVFTKKGSKSNIVLPDGTRVWINSDTRLSYPASFSKARREVFLSGEAYFDVTHDEQHPFIVHTQLVDIKVLGTTFNVRNYDNEPYMETVLVTGKIEVFEKERPDQKIILKPADKLKIHRDSVGVGAVSLPESVKPGQVQLVRNEAMEAAWLKDKLFFEDMPLKWIARELERRFDVTIVFKSPVTEQYRYTLYVEELGLEQVLQRIALMKPVKYTINNNREVIIE